MLVCLRNQHSTESAYFNLFTIKTDATNNDIYLELTDGVSDDLSFRFPLLSVELYLQDFALGIYELCNRDDWFSLEVKSGPAGALDVSKELSCFFEVYLGSCVQLQVSYKPVKRILTPLSVTILYRRSFLESFSVDREQGLQFSRTLIELCDLWTELLREGE